MSTEDNLEDFFDEADEAATDASEAQPEPVQEQDAPQEVEAEQAAETGEETEADEATSPPPGDEDKAIMGRVSALLNEREKRQAAERLAEEREREAADLKKRLAEMEKPQEAPKPVDPIDDPDGFYRQQRDMVEQAALSQRVQTSKMFAEQQHGAEAVEEAYAAFDAACNRDPAVAALSQSIIRNAHPIGEVVKWHQRQKLLDEIGEDPAAYRERIIAEYQAQAGQTTAAPTPQAPPEKPRIPPALGKGGGTAGDNVQSDEDAFDEVFN